MRCDFPAPEVSSHSATGDDPVLGNCCCWGVTILRKREWIPGVPVPQWIAGSLFQRWSFQVSSSQHHCCRDVSKFAADGSCSHFAASCISCFWISLSLLWFMCMADLVHPSFPQWGKCERRTAGRFTVTAHRGKVIFSEFYKCLQSFLFMELPARTAAKDKTAHPSEPFGGVQFLADTRNWDGLALILDICS